MKEATVSREMDSHLCKIDGWTTLRVAKLEYLKNVSVKIWNIYNIIVKLSAEMLNVIILNVIMLSVVAPFSSAVH